MIIQSDSAFNMNPPHIRLNKYVLYYNIVFPKKYMFTEHYTLMPDASGTISIAYNGKDILAELWGASITPTLLGSEPNNYSIMLLIELSPYGLYQLTHCHQAEFADKRLLLKDVDKKLYDSFYHGFEAAKDADDLFSICDKILYSYMENSVVSNGVLSASEIISNNHGQIFVSDLAKQVGYSERQLNRLFLMQIGISVKSYTRLVRFNEVLRHIQKSPCCLAALSQQMGYFDQAHFDKDFKAISGVTPKEYMKSMSNFYYDIKEASSILASRRDEL